MATIAGTNYPAPAAPKESAASSTVEAVSLDCVTKQYGSFRALDALSFSLEQGEIVALLGSNGAGKTTAIRVLLGLTRQTSGRAAVFGCPPGARQARTRVGAMLQVGRMPESLRVREHIELFRGYYPRPLPMAEILRVAGLQAVAEKLFGELSGGQKQRVLFALAIAGDPDLLFLDEPTLGMDVEARRALWVEVRALAARGKTVLLTTHYLQEAEALATRILLLKGGQLLLEGTPAQIRARAGASRVRCRSMLEREQLFQLPSVRDAVPDGERWTLASDAPEQTLRALLLQDSSVTDLEVSAVPFEEAFLSLTGDGANR